MPQIELSSTTLSIQTLYRMFRDGDFYVDRRYQRKLVWTLDEKQKLVDSILREFPIPLVLLLEDRLHRRAHSTECYPSERPGRDC
jgi:uncharacterized protein with ParB-like and HNH nuclease domain